MTKRKQVQKKEIIYKKRCRNNLNFSYRNKVTGHIPDENGKLALKVFADPAKNQQTEGLTKFLQSPGKINQGIKCQVNIHMGKRVVRFCGFDKNGIHTCISSETHITRSIANHDRLS